jgi:hypothetical protein
MKKKKKWELLVNKVKLILFWIWQKNVAETGFEPVTSRL